MFIGHFAVGFASKRYAPRVNLGWLLLAPILLDLLWPAFVLLGVEHFHVSPTSNPFLNLTFDYYPWSHSLLMAIAWGALFAFVWRLKGGTRREALVLAIGVVSHWVLDWVSHVPDMPLWRNGPISGLGLWRSPVATVVVEGVLLSLAAASYMNRTEPRDKIGNLGIWIYFLVLISLYAISIEGPQPTPGMEKTIAATAFLAGGLALAAGWIDRHREALPGSV